MTQQELLEYNKRCAEFLGYTLRENDCYNGDDKLVAKLSFLQTADLKFHSDWNWIMEVVEAIEKLTKKDGYGYEILITNSLCVIEETNKIFDSNQRFYAKTRKEAVVGAINQFLIWYEQNK